MQINSPTGSLPFGTVFGVAVAKKQLESTELQGKQALELIEASAPAPTAPESHIGRNLNIVA